MCIHRTLINACRDCFVWEQRHQRDRATGRKLRGGGRLPWSTGIRKFPALITKAKWRREQLNKIQNQKQVGKAGDAIFLPRRNIFHFRSPTTHFQCNILFKKRDSHDKTAEGQPVISLPQLTLTRSIPESTELECYIIQQNILIECIFLSAFKKAHQTCAFEMIIYLHSFYLFKPLDWLKWFL